MRSVPRTGSAATPVVVFVLGAAVGACGFWLATRRAVAPLAPLVPPAAAPADADDYPLPPTVDLSKLTPLLKPKYPHEKYESAVRSMRSLETMAARYNAGGMGEAERRDLHRLLRVEGHSYSLRAAEANAVTAGEK